MSGENPKLITSMDQSIFGGSYPIDKKIMQLDFDKIIESDIVKIIPVLRAIIAIYGGVLGIRDRFFLKKVVFFINQFNSGINTSEIERFVTDVLKDEKFRQKVNEKILIHLDRFDDEFKSLILAELLKNWVKKNIDWNEFVRLTHIIERAHPNVFIRLYDCFKINFNSSKPTDLGLKVNVNANDYALIMGSGIGYKMGNFGSVMICKDGIDICKYGLKNLLDDQYEDFPHDINEYLNKLFRERKTNHETDLRDLTDPFFSDYERWIVKSRSGDSLKIRKEIIEKIRKFYSI